MRMVLCYLMASHCNPMAFNRRIPSFIVAFLRVPWRVVNYASMQFRHLLYKQKRNQEDGGYNPPQPSHLKTLTKITSIKILPANFKNYEVADLRLRIQKS